MDSPPKRASTFQRTGLGVVLFGPHLRAHRGRTPGAEATRREQGEEGRATEKEEGRVDNITGGVALARAKRTLSRRLPSGRNT